MVSEDFLAFKEITKDISKMNKSTDRESISFLRIRTYTVKRGDSNVILHRSFKIQKYEFTAKWTAFIWHHGKSIQNPTSTFSLCSFGNWQTKGKESHRNLWKKCIRPWAYHSFYKTLPIRREGTHTEETKEDSNFD